MNNSGQNSGRAGIFSSFGTKIGKIIRLVRLVRLLRIMKALSQTNKNNQRNKKQSNKVAPISHFISFHSQNSAALKTKELDSKRMDLMNPPTSKEGMLT